jgi:ketosteroid isomerase-like protein
MVEEDFEVIRRAWAAASRGDVPAALELFHADIELEPFGAALHGRVYRGHEGFVYWWENETIANWERFEVHPEEFKRVGDRILVFGRWRARGRASGIDLDIPATWIIEVRDGKIARWRTYTDRAEALEVVGITGQDAHADAS